MTNLFSGSVRQLKSLVKPYLRRFRRVVVNEPLPPSGCRALIQILKPVVVLEKGDLFVCPLRVRNVGSHPWSPRGRLPVSLTARWLTSRKEPMDAPVQRVPLPTFLRPGEEVIVEAKVRALESLGHFLLEFDLQQESGAGFKERGSQPAYLDAQVTGRAREDIDYHKAYSTADLSRDYWTVVGPSTKAEFDRLSGVKLKHLIDLGLTPDSKVLDVGCGTGLLATAMEGYLSERGFYYGTDLGKEAISFCKTRFKRPNFAFAQNEMTRIPVTGMAFDQIVYYSVFTHTYPDETALLLAESKRLLAPNGLIFADLFASPLVERYSGNRGAVEVNLDHLMRLVELVGLKAELVMSGQWQQYGQRMFFKFTHR